MMAKRKLLRLVEKAKETEEKMVPIYANHIMLFSECLDLDSSIKEKIIRVFTQLRDESRQHRDNLDHLLKTIREEL